MLLLLLFSSREFYLESDEAIFEAQRLSKEFENFLIGVENRNFCIAQQDLVSSREQAGYRLIQDDSFDILSLYDDIVQVQKQVEGEMLSQQRFLLKLLKFSQKYDENDDSWEIREVREKINDMCTDLWYCFFRLSQTRKKCAQQRDDLVSQAYSNAQTNRM